MDFNNISFEMPKNRSASIKVIGVGGGGSNAINYMFKQGITGVDFIISNTDAQALDESPVPVKIQLGASITEGLGAGANPEVGEQAALETLDEIKSLLDTNTKMVFITAGMGGGTGTGAAPIIAKCAKEMGILTVGICTAPFSFEGKKRLDQAKKGIEKLRQNVDSLIIINNDKLRELYGNLGYKTGFAKADEVLATAAKGIAEVITHEYSINIDLRDAKTVLADSGTAIMGSAKASGKDKAKKAVELALDSPLLNDNKITGAKNVLLLILSGEDEVTLDEIGIINDHIQAEAKNNVNIIMGMGEDPDLGENMSVTIVATGFPQDQQALNSIEDVTIVHSLDDLTPKEPFLKEVEEPEEAPVSENTIFEETPAMETSIEEEEDEIKLVTPTKATSSHTVQDTTPEMSIEEAPLTESKEEGVTVHDLFSFDQVEEVESPKINPTPKATSPESSSDESTETKTTPSPSKTEIFRDIENEDQEIFNAPISGNLSDQIKERRERLKKFNFKFNTSLKENGDMKEPAYKRQGINVEAHKTQEPSNNIVDGENKIRPNNFLHDNVD